MHFNTGKLFFISTLFLPILASPIQNASTNTPDKFDPYAEENLKWHAVDLASLFDDDDDTDPARTRRDLSESLGLPSDVAADVSCIESGIKMKDTIVQEFIPQACPVLVGSFSYFKLIQSGWNMWEAFNLPDSGNNRASITYRQKSKGKNPINLSKELCKIAFKFLAKKSDCIEDGATQGATLKFKRDNDEESELQLGYDPNEQKEDHVSTQNMRSCKA